MSRLVYVPASAALATGLRSGAATGPWLGYTTGPGLAAFLEGPQPDAEEQEYAALNLAGVAHLVDPRAIDPRLVLAAEVEQAALSDLDGAAAGSVTVAALTWAQVTALFADESGAAAAVAAARAAVAGRSVTEALAAPEVVALLECYDLLWFAPEELDGFN